jgi:hypothetical protein
MTRWLSRVARKVGMLGWQRARPRSIPRVSLGIEVLEEREMYSANPLAADAWTPRIIPGSPAIRPALAAHRASPISRSHAGADKAPVDGAGADAEGTASPSFLCPTAVGMACGAFPDGCATPDGGAVSSSVNCRDDSANDISAAGRASEPIDRFSYLSCESLPCDLCSSSLVSPDLGPAALAVAEGEEGARNRCDASSICGTAYGDDGGEPDGLDAQPAISQEEDDPVAGHAADRSADLPISETASGSRRAGLVSDLDPTDGFDLDDLDEVVEIFCELAASDEGHEHAPLGAPPHLAAHAAITT